MLNNYKWLIVISSVMITTTACSTNPLSANNNQLPHMPKSASVTILSQSNLENWKISLQPDESFDAKYIGNGHVTTTTIKTKWFTTSGTGAGSPPPQIHMNGIGHFPTENENLSYNLSWIQDGKEYNGDVVFSIKVKY